VAAADTHLQLSVYTTPVLFQMLTATTLRCWLHNGVRAHWQSTLIYFEPISLF